MFTDLDPSVDCFTTDAAPTTLYANVPLDIALESKGCNYAASPTIPYQLLSAGVSRDIPFCYCFYLFSFSYNLGCHYLISRWGGLMSPRSRSVMRLGGHGSSRLYVSIGVHRGAFGRGHGDDGIVTDVCR